MMPNGKRVDIHHFDGKCTMPESTWQQAMDKIKSLESEVARLKKEKEDVIEEASRINAMYGSRNAKINKVLAAARSVVESRPELFFKDSAQMRWYSQAFKTK